MPGCDCRIFLASSGLGTSTDQYVIRITRNNFWLLLLSIKQNTYPKGHIPNPHEPFTQSLLTHHCAWLASQGAESMLTPRNGLCGKCGLLLIRNSSGSAPCRGLTPPIRAACDPAPALEFSKSEPCISLSVGQRQLGRNANCFCHVGWLAGDMNEWACIPPDKSLVRWDLFVRPFILPSFVFPSYIIPATF